jgi:hypothetical protein
MGGLFMLLDNRTGRELHSGDWIARKDYKGFIRRYELMGVNDDNSRVQVRELDGEDRWLYHSFALTKLNLKWVMV